MAWTPEQIEQLRKLAAAGQTFKQIADTIGTTRSAVASARKRYVDAAKLPQPPRVRHPRKPQAPPPKGTSAHAAQQVIKRAKVETQVPKFRWTKELDTRLKVLAMEGQTPKQIANTLGTTDASVRRQAKKLGVQIRFTPAHRAQNHRTGREQVTTLDHQHAVQPIGHAFMRRFGDGYEGQRGRLTITGLKATSCRFPIDTARGTRYCGQTAVPGVAYCDTHARRCFDLSYRRVSK